MISRDGSGRDSVATISKDELVYNMISGNQIMRLCFLAYPVMSLSNSDMETWEDHKSLVSPTVRVGLKHSAGEGKQRVEMVFLLPYLGRSTSFACLVASVACMTTMYALSSFALLGAILTRRPPANTSISRLTRPGVLIMLNQRIVQTRLAG